MTTKQIIVAVCGLFVLFCCHAQQNNNWYFGARAGLNFNLASGQPMPRIHTDNTLTADEGSSSISDKNGQLLFYSNGVTIYNKNHQQMINGDNIGGHLSAAQSCIIVPQPGNDSIYYVFTTDGIENNFDNGYRYSIVNVKRQNGAGEVIQKNQLLWGSCTERLTAARHQNGIDIWIITNDNNSNIFRAWLLSCNGLNQTPVVSVSGLVLTTIFANVGFMKVSPDGQQLCHTHFPYSDPGDFNPNFIQLFSFNNLTGVIDNPQQVGEMDAQYFSCEYSPNSQLLYLTRPYENKVEQMESRLPSLSAIHSSRVVLNTTAGFNGIQLGPDEKVYLIRPNRYLSRIEYPNIKGTGCVFSRDTIDLWPGYGRLGSPSFVNDAAVNLNNGFTYTILDSCAGIVQFNAVSNMSGTVNWNWDFGDGQTSTVQNPVHTFADPSIIYNVSIRITSNSACGEIFRTRFVQPFPFSNEITFSYTYKCSEENVYFTNPNDLRGSETFEWDFGDGQFSTDANPVHHYAVPQQYTVTLKRTSSNSCRDNIIRLPVSFNDPSMTISDDQAIVAGQTITIKATGDFISYQWTPADGLAFPNRLSTAATPLVTTTYTLTAINEEGCKSVDSVKITVVEPSDIFIPSGFTPNNDGLNDVIKPIYPQHLTLNEFCIYNRWGQKIYSTKNRGEGWNGRKAGLEQPAGVYVWLFMSKDLNGNPVQRKGTVVLIR